MIKLTNSQTLDRDRMNGSQIRRECPGKELSEKLGEYRKGRWLIILVFSSFIIDLFDLCPML